MVRIDLNRLLVLTGVAWFLIFKQNLGLFFKLISGFYGVFGFILGLIFWIFKTSDSNLSLNKIGA